jgi:hypothetical protein
MDPVPRWKSGFAKKSQRSRPMHPPTPLYDRLRESTLVGVLHLEQAWSDSRGQSVPAAFYTLRYALMPNDGNHLGVAPSRDLLLLVPASADPGPEAVPKFQDLVSLSRQASGTKHPAVLSLVSTEGATAPSLFKDDEGHVIFSCVMHLGSGEKMPLAMVVKGTGAAIARSIVLRFASFAVVIRNGGRSGSNCMTARCFRRRSRYIPAKSVLVALRFSSAPCCASPQEGRCSSHRIPAKPLISIRQLPRKTIR